MCNAVSTARLQGQFVATSAARCAGAARGGGARGAGGGRGGARAGRRRAARAGLRGRAAARRAGRPARPGLPRGADREGSVRSHRSLLYHYCSPRTDRTFHRVFVSGIDEEFMPWLVDEVSSEIESIVTSRDVITGT